MAKGIEFEAKALEYLKNLFEKLGFHVTEARQQRSGTQDGFDLRISFLDGRKRERQFYFECKNYDTAISWDAIAVKIFELYSSNHRPDGYIAVSPHVDFSNKHIDLIAKMAGTIGAPIKWWTPETNVKEYFSLDVSFFEYVYNTRPAISDKALYLEEIKLRYFFEEMLRQKDKIAGDTYTNSLTLKIPTLNTDDLIGREKELKELHFLLFGHKKQVVVVNGLGGIGKTSLAQAYISKYMGDYRNVAWITQTTNDIVSEIANAEGLAQKLMVSKEGKDAQQIFYDIITALKKVADGPNLLIIDNVDDTLGKWKDYLPTQPHWHVLTTSREIIDGFYPIELDFLSHEEAIALFKKHCSTITSENEISDLVKTVDYHTLTIEILAKTANRHRTDIATLKKAIKDDLNANVYIPHGAGKIDKVRSYLCSIFNFSGLNDNETWLMKQFVCLPAEYHAYARLLELIDPDENRKAEFSELCNSLTEQGWLLQNKETDAYKMHLVVQEVARQQLFVSLTDIDRLLGYVISQVSIDQNRDNPVDRFQWIPFGYAVLNNFQNGTSPVIGILQNNLAVILRILGEYKQARELFQKAIIIDEKNFGPDNPSTVLKYSNLAAVLKELGEYEQARELFQKAIIADEKNFGPDHPSTVMKYSNLATLLKELGEYEQARELFQKAIIADEKNFGPDHPVTAMRYTNLAIILSNLGEYEQARELLQKSVVSNEKNFGPDHPSTSTTYSSLALVLSSQGKYEHARELLQKAIISDEKNFGPDHPSTMERYSNLATVLNYLGEYEQARELLQKVVIFDEKNFGPNHASTAIGYTNLATVLMYLGEHKQAQNLFQKAIIVNEKIFAPDHPTTARSYSNLASLFLKLREYEQARELLQKVVISDEKNFGPDNPTTALTYSNLASVLLHCNHIQEAYKLAEKALLIFKKHLPEGHPYISQVNKNVEIIKRKLPG